MEQQQDTTAAALTVDSTVKGSRKKTNAEVNGQARAQVDASLGTIIRVRADQLELIHDDNARRYTNLDVKEMEDQLLDDGVQLQPVGVRPMGENGLYRVVWGFRRSLALTNIQRDGVPDDHPLSKVNVVVYQGSEQDYLLANMGENVHRKDLSPVEIAHRAKRMIDEFGMKKKDLARRLGMTPGYLSQITSVLSLPTTVQKMIHTGKMALTTGYEISQLEGEAREKAIAEAINSAELSGRATKADVRKSTRETTDAKAKKDRTYKELKSHLMSLMEKLRVDDGGSEEDDWTPPKGYQVLEAVLDYAAGKRGAQKRLWDLISEL